MDLNTVLLQQQEVETLLSNLQDTHKRVLNLETGTNEDLDRIRRDILICLNDLRKVNLMIIDSRDGLIKKSVAKLEKYEDRLKALQAEEAVIEEKLNEWTTEKRATTSHSSQKDKDKDEQWGSISIKLVGNHSSILNSYIDTVGIENTTLADDGNEEDANHHTPMETAAKFTREQLLDNVQKLRLCEEQVNVEIEQLRSLLSQYEKDKSIITDELRRNNDHIQGEINSLLREKDRINDQRRKILRKLGLIKDHDQIQTNKSKLLFSLSALTAPDNSDFDIALSQAFEFIDAKKQVLKKILRENKAQTSILHHRFSTWEEVLQLVQGLEANLQKEFVERNGNVPRETIATMINNILKQVISIMGNEKEDSTFTSIHCEINALQRALKELNIERTSTPTPIRSSSKAPDILQMGKSPPKVGISREFASNMSQSVDDFSLKSNKND